MAKKQHFYKIGDACRLLDIQPYVLRYWETEFGALRPSKSKSGQRVYSEDEIAIIRRIKVLLYDEGYTIAGAKKKLEAELEVAARGLFAEPVEAVEPADAPEVEPALPSPAPVKARRESRSVAASQPEAASASGANADFPASSPPGAVAPASEIAPALDTPASQRIETLRRGVAEALAEARALLTRLDQKSVESES
jgi:DNA-binding transcriptional MerR regulator